MNNSVRARASCVPTALKILTLTAITNADLAYLNALPFCYAKR